MVHVDIMESHIAILDSIKLARELLERRSSIYSDRHEPETGSRMALPTQLEEFRPMEQRAVHGLLRKLLDSPDDFSHHLMHLISTVMHMPEWFPGARLKTSCASGIASSTAPYRHHMRR
jgi:hypothetical protein